MELTFKLKQHTPIIHFQPDQKGATLRATELKPKLDRYIKKICSLDPKKNLRYQLKISSSNKIDVPDVAKDGLYFGGIGTDKKEIEKEGLLHNNITLRINTYFDKDLYNKIPKVLPVCLAMENFGTRQNKGYGCFFDKEIPMDKFEKILKENAPSRVFFWDVVEKDTFFSIKTVYSLLKSGINLPSLLFPLLNTTNFNDLKKKNDKFKDLAENQQGLFNTKGNYTEVNTKKIRDRHIKELLEPYMPQCSIYSKSLLFKYFKSKGITWDKKAIKMRFIPTAKSDSFKSDEKKFVRVFLGKSDHQDWVKNGFQLLITSNEFSRVPSPVVFKVFKKDNSKSRVYFYSRELELYKNLLGKEFKFTTDKSNGQLSLKTPDEFDMDNYLTWAVNEINTNLVVDEKKNSHAVDVSGEVFGLARKRTLEILNKVKGNINEL